MDKFIAISAITLFFAGIIFADSWLAETVPTEFGPIPIKYAYPCIETTYQMFETGSSGQVNEWIELCSCYMKRIGLRPHPPLPQIKLLWSRDAPAFGLKPEMLAKLFSNGDSIYFQCDVAGGYFNWMIVGYEVDTVYRANIND